MEFDMVEANSPHDEFGSFLEYLKAATEKIDAEYFLLPIAGLPLPVYRERVYCYELYHQLRLIMVEDAFNYSLSGEVDKSAHPKMRGRDITDSKPDLLVHTPGQMEGNLVIIEVKPITANRSGIRKDLRTLTAFRRIGYHWAIYLIFGDDERGIDRIISTAHSLQDADREERIDLNLISLLWHYSPGKQVISVPW
jgi:hypothetical protein